MQKDEIRKKILSLRRSQPKEEARKKDSLIQDKLFKLQEFVNAKTILFYISKEDEVGTEQMIKKVLKEGKRVVVPISEVKKKDLLLSELKDFDKELEPRTFNILEPKKEFRRLISPDELDLIIVPGVAFDLSGNRLGRGMGFYDRFLKRVKKNIPIIGLAYDFQILEKIPVNEMDVKVNKIITEKRILNV